MIRRIMKIIALVLAFNTNVFAESADTQLTINGTVNESCIATEMIVGNVLSSPLASESSSISARSLNGRISVKCSVPYYLDTTAFSFPVNLGAVTMYVRGCNGTPGTCNTNNMYFDGVTHTGSLNGSGVFNNHSISFQLSAYASGSSSGALNTVAGGLIIPPGRYTTTIPNAITINW